MKIERVFHHHEVCEEYKAGMWRTITGVMREHFIQQAAALMRDIPAFKNAMCRAIEEWPFSCEMNLSATEINRLAWLGHAGCCIATQSPEETTRLGWHRLDQLQQDAANKAAEEVVYMWEDRQKRKLALCQSANLELMF